MAAGALFPRTGKDRHQDGSEAVSREGIRRAWSGKSGTARWSHIGAETRLRGRDQVARQSGQQSCCTVSSRAHVPGTHLLRAATLTYPGAGQARASSPPTGVRSQRGPPRWPCSLSPGSTLTVAKAPAEGGGKPTERARPDPHPAAGAGPRATRWCGTSVPQAPRKRKP